MTMLKLIPQTTKTGFSSLESFSRFITSNPKSMTPQVFSQELGKVQRMYMKEHKHDMFCKSAEAFADELTNSNSDFAGIIMSALCKITEFFPEKLEPLAKKGYVIAKNNGDCVHMMARLNDLRKVYYRRYDKLNNYINVLYKQEECLVQLNRNYDGAVSTYRTVARHAADKKDYEQMLAHVRVEIGKLVKRKHPEEAKIRLIEAREIFAQRGNKRNVDYIEMLLDEIDNASFNNVI